MSFFFTLFLLTLAAAAQAQTNYIAEALQPYVDRGEMPGFVSILATPDKILQVDTIGYSNIETKKPISPDDVFWIASTTKIFTATAVMILVDEGKINLDDPGEKYLPDLKNLKVAYPQKDGTTILRSPKSKPTVRQLLSHVTGWTFQTPLMARFGTDRLEPQVAVMHFVQTPLVFEPGEKYQYTELGIDTAGAIIEVASGMPYHEYLQKRIFDPLGMTSTSFWPSAKDRESRWITNYAYENNKLTARPIPMMLTLPYDNRAIRHPEPGAGLFSTANDLTKFFQMLAANGRCKGKQIISEKSLGEIRRKQTPSHLSNNYGLCAAINGDWFGHGGAMGNDGNANIKEGLVRVYAVQIGTCPQKGKSKNDWVAATDKTFEQMKKDGRLPAGK